MQIANPIYDVVFKYLMKDNKVAKLLLSAILEKEIIELTFRPTEIEAALGETLTVMRIDFNAKIKEKNGEEKIVILELQKAKLPSDIMRFRRYLGEQYSNTANSVEVTTKGGHIYKQGLPIISIYFLGHNLNYADCPVIRVSRKCYDVATGMELAKKETFIEALTHDSVIIQILKLKGKRRTELEKLLSIFDQSKQSKTNKHVLNITEGEIPARYKTVVRRLIRAIAEEKVRKVMTVEDDYLESMQSYERLVSKQKEAIKAKDKAIEEKDKALQTKEEELEQLRKQIEALKKKQK